MWQVLEFEVQDLARVQRSRARPRPYTQTHGQRQGHSTFSPLTVSFCFVLFRFVLFMVVFETETIRLY